MEKSQLSCFKKTFGKNVDDMWWYCQTVCSYLSFKDVVGILKQMFSCRDAEFCRPLVAGMSHDSDKQLSHNNQTPPERWEPLASRTTSLCHHSVSLLRPFEAAGWWSSPSALGSASPSGPEASGSDPTLLVDRLEPTGARGSQSCGNFLVDAEQPL